MTFEQQEIADLRAQLERARADHAATVAALDELRSLQISEEHAARLAAEGQAAELRTALEWILKILTDNPLSSPERRDRGIDGAVSTARRALAATPSGSGAAAVLAVTIEMDEATEAGDLERIAELSPKWIAAVTAWRAARGDQGGTGG